MTDATILIVLAVTSLGAATVNGALGYGYSSISVPIALLVVAGRVLNPALVIVEVAINLYALVWNRRAIGRVLGRVLPLAIGLAPGVVIGALLLGRVAPASAKLAVYLVLLPLILIQASGRRWPIRSERAASLPLGAGVGILYGLTTISGPPLALFWNNQGLAKEDFRVGLAVVRSIESLCALAAYAWLGMLTHESAGLLTWIVPGVLIGVPIGHALIRRVSSETFRHACMSVDAYLVAFGLSRTLIELGIAPGVAYQVLVATAVVDLNLWWSFVHGHSPARAQVRSIVHAEVVHESAPVLSPAGGVAA
ncbi:MAG: sulfite exporter TauE/SafE family protein [Kofleriaceae bacterium]